MTSHRIVVAGAGAMLASILAPGAKAIRKLNSEKNPKAFNGERVPQDLLGHLAGIDVIPLFGSEPTDRWCGVTVLEGGWLLSAAHCFSDYGSFIDHDRVYVTLHDGERITPEDVTAVIVPDEFDGAFGLYGDIALVRVPKLEKRSDIDYARLPNSREEAEAATILVAIGEGRNGPWEDDFAEHPEFVSLVRAGGVGDTPRAPRDSGWSIGPGHFVMMNDWHNVDWR